MLRLLGLLVVAAAAFGAGFYYGMQHKAEQIAASPEAFLAEYGKLFGDTAREKYEKVKKALLEE